MPSERGSTVLCDLVELHGEMVELHGTSLTNLIEIVEATTGDGFVDPDDTRLLKSAAVLAVQTFRSTAETYDPLPTRASEQDDAFRLIGAAAGAGRVTKHVFAVAREAAADVRGAA